MKYRIVTGEHLSPSAIKQALKDLLAVLGENGVQSVTVLFGFAWGNDFNAWHEMMLNLDDVPGIIEYVEGRGYGSLGDDDLFLKFRIGNFFSEFQFCHHSDIHWEFVPDRERSGELHCILEFFKSTFDSLLCERERSGPPGEQWESIDLSIIDTDQAVTGTKTDATKQ